MSEEFIKILDHLCDKLGVAIDWSAENVLPYAQQLMEKYVTHELWSSVAIIAIWAIILAVCTIITQIARQKAKKDDWNYKKSSYDFAWFWMIITCIVIFALLGVTFKQIFDIIACLTFPEKLVFELVANMK